MTTYTQDIKENKIDGLVKLSFKEKFSYGCGDFGTNCMYDACKLFLLMFYTDIAGISPVIAGSIFLVARLFDAVADVVTGNIVDHMRVIDNEGKLRRIMLKGSFWLMIMTVLVFLTPNASHFWKVVYAYASYMIWGVVFAFSNITYGSLASSMTRDSNQRTTLAVYKMIGSNMGLLFAAYFFFPTVYLFADRKLGDTNIPGLFAHNIAFGFIVGATLLAVVGFIGFVICAKGTKERIVTTRQHGEKFNLKDAYAAIGHNRPLLTIMGMTLFYVIANSLYGTMLVYYFRYGIRNIALYSNANLFIMAIAIATALCMPFIARKMGKKGTAILGFMICIVAQVINYYMPDDNLYLFITLLAVALIGYTLPVSILNAMVADAIDYGEWKTGQRREGVTFSGYNFSRRVAQSLGGFAGGIGLSLVGYVPNVQQSEHTIHGIKFMLLIIPSIGYGIAACFILLFYTLNETRCKEMFAELKGRTSSTISQ